jgi:hypothetical protein
MGLALWKLIVEGRATDEHWNLKIRTCKKRKRLQELKGESAEKARPRQSKRQSAVAHKLAAHRAWVDHQAHRVWSWDVTY